MDLNSGKLGRDGALPAHRRSVMVEKLAWIQHGSKTRIFSMDIQREDGHHLIATAAADANVRIWQMPQTPSEPGRLLATLHEPGSTRSVTCVRWARRGLYLASSSDRRVVVHELRPDRGGIQPLHGAADEEKWGMVTRLQGHNMAVVGLDWSPNDSLLASCSLDGTVRVWDATTWAPQAVAVLKHGSPVKGVVFDPLGELIASQLQDGSVTVWSGRDWKSAWSTSIKGLWAKDANLLFMRLSWSPCGQYLTAPAGFTHDLQHAAPLVATANWRPRYHLRGHTAPVSAVKFHHALFRASARPQLPAYGVVALGSRDRSLSVWTTQNPPRQICLAKSAFKYDIMDLAWSSDGFRLLGCSVDGTVAMIAFDVAALGEKVNSDQEIFVFNAMEGPGHLDSATSTTLKLLRSGSGSGPRTLLPRNNDLLQLQVESCCKIRLDGAPCPQNLQQELRQPADGLRKLVSHDSDMFPVLQMPTDLDARSPVDGRHGLIMNTPDLLPPKLQGGVEKLTSFADAGDQLGALQVIFAAGPLGELVLCLETILIGSGVGDIPSLGEQTIIQPSYYIRCSVMGGDRHDRVVVWEDKINGAPTAIAANSFFATVAVQGGKVHLYKQRGSKLPARHPAFRIVWLLSAESRSWGEEVVSMACSEGCWSLLLFTNQGYIYVWDMQKKRIRCTLEEHLPSCRGLLSSVSVVGVRLSDRAEPVITLQDGWQYVFRYKLRSWVRVPLWPPATSAAGRNKLLGSGGTISRSALEAQIIHPASAQEYRKCLISYARFLITGSDEARLRSLCEDLLGWAGFSPDTHPALGLSRRSVLCDHVLPAMAESQSGFVQDLTQELGELVSECPLLELLQN